MNVSCNKMFKLLIDKEFKKEEFVKKIGIIAMPNKKNPNGTFCDIAYTISVSAGNI